jgi:proteasome lid subunit RPN8/RPN11
LSPYAWAKLLFLRDSGDCEVGGFGITGADGLLLIEDVRLVRQYSTPVSVRFDDAAVADFFDEQVDRGRRPEQFARVWVHTHPGNSPQPSGTDEETFQRCFGGTDWSVMFVLARGGRTNARLQFNVGPGGSMEIPVEVDFRQPFGAADQLAWKREYADAVEADVDWFGDLGGDKLERWCPEGHFEADGEAFPDVWIEHAAGDLSCLNERGDV